MNEATQKVLEACVSYCDALIEGGENVHEDYHNLLELGHHRDRAVRDSLKGHPERLQDIQQRALDALAVPAE